MERQKMAVKPIIDDKKTANATHFNSKACAEKNQMMVNGEISEPRIFRFYRVNLFSFHSMLFLATITMIY